MTAKTISPTQSSTEQPDHPVYTAYRLGRVLKRLQFVGCECCLELRLSSEVEYAFDRLCSATRSAVPADMRYALEASICDSRAAFWQTVHSEWWSDDFYRLRQQLVDTGGDTNDHVKEIIQGLLGPVDRIIVGLQNELLGYLNSKSQTAFRLGLVVESAQCYWDVQSSTSRSFSSVQPADLKPFNDDRGKCLRRPTAIASGCRFHAVAIPSLPSWLHELQHLWHELGFPDDSLPVWQKIGDEMETPEQLERYLTQLDSGVHSLAINHLGFEPPPVPALPSYLDLALNGHTYSVSRLGFQVIAQVEESPLRWQIVLSLVNARGRYLSLNELRDTAWPAAGLSPKVGIGTVYNEISLLRKLLAPLDIGIGCATKLGYRLEASIEPDELGS